MTRKASVRARSTISGTQPGYRDNLRPLLWLLQLKNGQVNGRTTPVGVLQTLDELDIDGIEILAADLKKLLTIHVDRWRQEMPHRDRHLRQFTDLPDEIWQANRGSPPASTPPTGNPSERSTRRLDAHPLLLRVAERLDLRPLLWAQLARRLAAVIAAIESGT